MTGEEGATVSTWGLSPSKFYLSPATHDTCGSLSNVGSFHSTSSLHRMAIEFLSLNHLLLDEGRQAFIAKVHYSRDDT